ncbi:tetratricopeptide repeat protein [Corallococcus exiguus]|uniref:tetratricopeptide repeat protein n=1 Tax=Corallococcus exiguus TaxID=83462 RepID=UPI001A8C805A|nr:tetratricopeptide repeat protein [Corallococcus exiguus]MBN8465870.1 tetratricopeptide repeat protein [Corallococcus exiguus]
MVRATWEPLAMMPATTEPSARPSPRLQALGVVLAALVVYAPALVNGFVYDDFVLVEENPWLTSSAWLGEVFTQQLFGFVPTASASAAFYRPLIHVLLLGVHAVAGMSPVAYHLVPVVLHALASLGVWALARRLLQGQSPGAALVAGLLFAVHPVHVEAVAWVSALMDVSATTAGLAMLWLLTARPLAPARAVAGALMWLVALLFKEVAVMLPVMLLVWEVAVGTSGEGWWRERAWRYGPLVLVAGAYAALRLNAVGWATVNSGWASVPVGWALLNALPLLAHYARLLALPGGLSVFHPFEPTTSLMDGGLLAGLGVGVAIVAGGVLAYRRARVAWMGLCWTLLPLLPALHLRALGESAVSERYAYLPSVGFCLLVAAGWNAWARREAASPRAWVPALVAGAVLLAATARSGVQVGVWQNEVSLWANAAELHPDTPTPHYQLGAALLRENEAREALGPLEHAVVLRPTDALAVSTFARALTQSGQPARARELLEAALPSKPGQAGFHLELGEAQRALGEDEAAARAFRQAATLAPGTTAAWRALGETLLRLGRAKEAVEPLEKARALSPDSPAVLQALARAHHALGDEARAVEHEAAAARAGASKP